jgi:hypothetical protein
MNNVLLTALVVMDVILLGAVWLLARRRESFHSDILGEISEERRLLAEQQRTLQDDLQLLQEKGRGIADRISHLAMEVEQEVRAGREAIGSELSKIAGSLQQRFDEPLHEMTSRQRQLETLIKQIDARKDALQRLLARGEKLGKLFSEQANYEQVFQELQERKYSDARALLAKGTPARSIMAELGLSESEAKVILGVSRS